MSDGELVPYECAYRLGAHPPNASTWVGEYKVLPYFRGCPTVVPDLGYITMIKGPASGEFIQDAPPAGIGVLHAGGVHILEQVLYFIGFLNFF